MASLVLRKFSKIVSPAVGESSGKEHSLGLDVSICDPNPRKLMRKVVEKLYDRLS